MFPKLNPGLLLAVLALFIAIPTTDVFAATSSSTKKQIKKLSDQLKKLPTAGAPASKVNQLLIKLTKLDPKKAASYYKIGLTKLSNADGTASANATKIAFSVGKLLKKSGLPSSQIKKISRQVTNANLDYSPPAPPSPVS